MTGEELKGKIDEIHGRIGSEDKVLAFEGICILSEERRLSSFTGIWSIRDSIISVIRAFRNEL
jgi:hypothetical protein